jgi:integrase
VEKLGNFLGPIGICDDEVEGATDLPRLVAERLFRQVADAQDKVRKKPRNFTLKAPDVTIDDVREKLPAALKYLRETSLDKDHGHEYPLGPRFHDRLVKMRTSKMQVLATVVLSIQRSFYPFAKLDFLLSAQERQEDLFMETGEDPDDPSAIARVLDAYCVDRTLFPKDTDALRVQVADLLFASRSILRSYASLRPEHRSAILELIPVLPSPDCEFERQHRGISRRMALENTENRKLFSDPLADQFDPILSACRTRRNQIRRMELRCRVIERKMLENDELTGKYIRGDEMAFHYRDRVITPTGRRLTSHQRIYLKAHRQSALIRGHSAASIVFEFIRVEGEGGRRHDPWFVELFASGALLKPTRIPVSMRDRRHEVIARHTLPDRHDKPDGLAGTDRQREADLFGKMLSERGMVLIPVWAMSHAMTLAYLMVRVMAYSFCRIGEALQMTYHVEDPEHWTTLKLDGKTYQAFLAIPKGWDDYDEFLVDDTTAKLIAVLAMMTKSREKAGKLMPAEGSRELSELKKDGKKLYVFAFRGRPISTSDMNYMFRILTAGFGKLRSHDIRHAASNCADKEKLGMKMIKLLLRHRGEGHRVARRYARKTKPQLDAAKLAFFNDAEAREILETCEDRT